MYSYLVSEPGSIFCYRSIYFIASLNFFITPFQGLFEIFSVTLEFIPITERMGQVEEASGSRLAGQAELMDQLNDFLQGTRKFSQAA